MCNLYSMTRDRAKMLARFGVKDNRATFFEPKAAIFPGHEAPVVRIADDGERMLEMMYWGFVRRPPGKAPGRVGNVRNDQILVNKFWTASFRERRCLVPVSSYCEPVGLKPAKWYWHALKGSEDRPLFAFPGIWRDYTGPIKKDGENVTQRVYSFLTCQPNELPAAQHHERMPVLLTKVEEFETWLHGSAEEALALAKPFSAEAMQIVQQGSDRKDLGATSQ